MSAYVVGTDANHELVVLLPSGEWYHPHPISTTTPEWLNVNITHQLKGQGQSTSLEIPGTLISGRIYISSGGLRFGSVLIAGRPAAVLPDWNNANDPSSQFTWSYIELTTSELGTTVDISYVDFVSLPLGIQMQCTANRTMRVRGINSTAVGVICNQLANFATQDQPWNHLCSSSSDRKVLRVMSPGKYIAIAPGAFRGYYEGYVDKVYPLYSSSKTLYIDGQTNSSIPIACKVVNDRLDCSGASRTFPKPSTEEIFSCSSTLSVGIRDNSIVKTVIPRLCAAFQRSTLLLDGGDNQPYLSASNYYTANVTNRYAQLVHANEPDSLGYAFPFDDVHPTRDEDASGTMYCAKAVSLTITVDGS